MKMVLSVSVLTILTFIFLDGSCTLTLSASEDGSGVDALEVKYCIMDHLEDSLKIVELRQVQLYHLEPILGACSCMPLLYYVQGTTSCNNTLRMKLILLYIHFDELHLVHTLATKHLTVVSLLNGWRSK